MEIIFKGKQNSEDAAESVASILRLFKERYQIEAFREMHISVTLVDQYGDDVDLVDSETQTPYRIFEVCRNYQDLVLNKKRTALKLIVDNSKNEDHSKDS